MRSMTKTLGVLSAVAALAGCFVDDADVSSTEQDLIQDAVNGTGGTPGFFFSPPLVDSVVTSGAFDNTYAARLTVDLAEVDCTNMGNVGAVVHTFPTVTLVNSAQRYKVTFTSSAGVGMLNNQCYRIIPKLDGAALGYRDMFVSSGSTAAPVGYKKWGFGGTALKTIAFRLEDMDPDTDGVLSHVDNCDFDANVGQADPDTDGVGTACDNCPAVANPDQADADSDGTGDACEPVCVSIPDQIAAFSGNNTTADAAGGAAGVWTGTTTYAAGAVGAGFSFNGSSNVTAPFTHSGAFSVQLWAKANTIQGNRTGLLSIGGGTNKSTTFQIDWNSTGGYRFSAGLVGLNRNFGAASTSAFQHLVVTSDGAGGYVLYRDGVQVATGTYATPLVWDRIAIGTNRGAGLSYNGIIDDVRVWDRALGAGEVAAAFAAAGNGVCDPI